MDRFVPSMITMDKVIDMNMNMGTTDQCAYIPLLFGTVSQPDNHHAHTRRLDYRGFVAYFAEDYMQVSFWSCEA